MQPFNEDRIEEGAVDWLERNGLGDEAIAIALIAGCTFPVINDYHRIFQYERQLTTMGWFRPARAAIAWCLACGVPLVIRK